MRLVSLILVCLLAAPVVCAQVTDDAPSSTLPATNESVDLPPLTTAASVRSLTPQQAAERRAVKLRGVVTFTAPVPPVFFVQDATGGVCVEREVRPLRPQLRLGDVVEVEGVTAPGKLVPYVTGRGGPEPLKISVARELGPLPIARQVNLGDLASPERVGDYVEARGVVRSARTETLGPNPAGPEALVLTLAWGGRRAEAVAVGRNFDPTLADRLVGTTVRARGVFNGAGPDRPPAATMRLLLTRGVRDLRPRPLQPAAPFELPFTTVASLRAAPADSASEPGRVRVKGVVTLAVAGKGLFLQGDDGSAAWVEPAGAKDMPALKPGDALDVVGFPARRGWSAALEDSVWKPAGKAPLPDAPLVTAEQALAGELDARLVRVEALVLAVSRLAEGTTLVLQSGEKVFLARLANATSSAPPSFPAEGTWVRVTGVCVNNRMPGAGDEPPATTQQSSLDPTGRPVSFHLLLASPAAVEIIRAPGWWTLTRVLIAAGILAAVTIAAFAWVVALRRRVARQTEVIRATLARQTLYEERVRIARDLHDSLEQDLLGITMQLTATEKQLADPDKARRALHLAAKMVRRSQAETHRAVWDLRDERRNGQDGLIVALREAVAGLTAHAAGDVPDVAVGVTGEPRPLPPQVENHVLRIALEAVTNALKHAGAGRVDLALDYQPGSLSLRIADDGRGFDADRPPPPSSGHFGLFGMRERAEKLGAALAVQSKPGAGTEVRMSVPLNGSAANGGAA